jgi:hypothetical protein
MSSVLRSKTNNKQSTAFYVNEVDVADSELYDESGNALPDKYTLLKTTTMEQLSNKVQVTNNNDYTELYCDATLSGWQGSSNQYAYSAKTITSNKAVTVIFTSPQSSQGYDFIVGFADASKVGASGLTFAFIPEFNGSFLMNYGFYFWGPNAYGANSVFKMEYDGAGTMKLYANDSLVRTTKFSFNTVFPNGMKLFTIFNEGGGAGHEYTVRFTKLAISNPARSLLCRNMGKQYVISDNTYLKVQTLSAPARNFYIKFNNTSYNKFVSYNL